jgi:DNA-directed RNA polymerase subunit M/transcription elongation factor TFIIS
MSIWFNCKKCGETLAVAEKKAGRRVACPKCQAANKIPGVAMQSQATKEQIEQLQTALNHHRQSLWVLLILFIFAIGMSLFCVSISSTTDKSVDLIGLGLLIVMFIILIRVSELCEFLGASKVINLLLFLFLWPVWLIVCVILYVKLKRRIAYLKQAEVRSDEI